MKTILYILLISIVALSSCTKIIDVDLNESNPKVVLEANYSSEDSTVRVKVSLTSSYFNADPSVDINSAAVTIIDHLGNSIAIPSIENGMYELTNYIPIYNTTYTMNVVYNANSYTANCQMFNAVPLEDITYEYFPSFFGSDPGYAAILNYYDPAGIENYYVVVQTVNSKELNSLTQLILQDDNFTDGNLVERPLFTNNLFELIDTIALELRAIDKVVYDYLNQIISITADQSSAPGNPNSNWDNDALGYFNCYSSSRKEVIIL